MKKIFVIIDKNNIVESGPENYIGMSFVDILRDLDVVEFSYIVRYTDDKKKIVEISL